MDRRRLAGFEEPTREQKIQWRRSRLRRIERFEREIRPMPDGDLKAEVSRDIAIDRRETMRTLEALQRPRTGWRRVDQRVRGWIRSSR